MFLFFFSNILLDYNFNELLRVNFLLISKLFKGDYRRKRNAFDFSYSCSSSSSSSDGVGTTVVGGNATVKEWMNCQKKCMHLIKTQPLELYQIQKQVTSRRR